MIVNPDVDVCTVLKPEISGKYSETLPKNEKHYNLQKTKRTLNTEI